MTQYLFPANSTGAIRSNDYSVNPDGTLNLKVECLAPNNYNQECRKPALSKEMNMPTYFSFSQNPGMAWPWGSEIRIYNFDPAHGDKLLFGPNFIANSCSSLKASFFKNQNCNMPGNPQILSDYTRIDMLDSGQGALLLNEFIGVLKCSQNEYSGDIVILS